MIKSTKMSNHIKYDWNINFTDNHNGKYVDINNLHIKDRNFGSQKFYIYNFDGLSTDGLLGYDFFKIKLYL